MNRRRSLLALLLAAAVVLAGGCAAPPVAPVAVPAAKDVLRSVAMDRALEDRILALDPARITAADVRETLSNAPAPRILLIRGGIYPVYLAMESMGDFLLRMGYPESRIRTPHENDWSLSPYESAPTIAGMIAWCY